MPVVKTGSSERGRRIIYGNRKKKIGEFDSALAVHILNFMSIPAADLRKIVQIVRQYEVIYGGGISSGDAAVREECESIVGVLEAELGVKRASSSGASRIAKSLPSLVDAKKLPRSGKAAKPSSARSSEIARLGRPRVEEPKTGKAGGASGTKSVAAGRDAVKKGKASAPAEKAAGSAATKGKTKEKAKGKAAEAPKGAAPKSTKPAKSAGARDLAIASRAGKGNDDVLKDVRSRHVSAARAALERDAKIAGAADDSDEVETKRHFAALHLFDAFTQNRLPKYGGFIVSIRFDQESAYAVIEIIGYENLQDLYPDGDTLVFKSVGCKLYALVEPARYYLKSVEPVNRPSEQMVPYRFSELLRISTKRFQSIFIGRKPVFMPTSFSVFKPTGEDIAVLFYDIADVYANIQDFLIMVLRDRLNVPIPDSRKAAEIIVRGIHEFKLWLDEA
jgi:hypothetical protein